MAYHLAKYHSSRADETNSVPKNVYRTTTIFYSAVRNATAVSLFMDAKNPSHIGWKVVANLIVSDERT